MLKHKPTVKTKRIITLIVIIVIAGAFISAVYKAIIPKEYRIFTEKRISALEREYNMNLCDAELKRYWVSALTQDIFDRFRFSVKDYSNFMENNYFGEIIYSDERDDKTYAEYKCKPYSSKGDPENRYTFLLRFQKNHEGFSAELVSYYE